MSSKAYNIISADDHVQEPPDAWQSRVVGKLKSRAPCLRFLDLTDQRKRPRLYGMTPLAFNCAISSQLRPISSRTSSVC